METNVEKKDDKAENNLTISTKMSTDQLICKTPQGSPLESPIGSVRSLRNGDVLLAVQNNKERTPIVLYLGVLQILFGLLMAVFGVLVLVQDANMSQIGGGLWGGCLAAITGVLGVLSTARDCCPLKTHFQRLAQTAFLALSLVCLAVAHLVLVISAIGLARDSGRVEYVQLHLQDEEGTQTIETELPHYGSVLANAGLLLVSACECVAAAMAAYHCSRALCPCFRPDDCNSGQCGDCTSCRARISSSGKDVLVSDWLGKQQQSPFGPMYIVPSSKRMTPLNLTPVFTMTPPTPILPASVMGYPLIPAPLGPTPPPIIHHNSHKERYIRKRQRYPPELHSHQIAREEKKLKKQKQSKPKQKTITTEEVAKTYTGLDRVIAEEFIEICDSARNTNTSTSSSDTTGGSNSEASHSGVIVEKL